MDPIFTFAMGVVLAASSSCVAYLWVEKRAAKAREKASRGAWDKAFAAGVNAENERYLRSMETRKPCGHRVACSHTKAFDVPGVGQRCAVVCEACHERHEGVAYGMRKASEIAAKCSSGQAAAHQINLAANEKAAP